MAEAHDPLDAGAVVPGAVEDHDLAGRRQVRHVALEIHLRLLPLGRRRQGDDAEDPRADALDDALDHAALAGRVAALEDDDDPRARLLHPGLQVRDLDLQPGELLLVGAVAGLLRLGRVGLCDRCCPWFSSCSWRLLLRPGLRAPRRRAARPRGPRRPSLGPIAVDHSGALRAGPRLGVELGEAEGMPRRRARPAPPRASPRRCCRPARPRSHRAPASGCRPAGRGDLPQPALT